MSKQITLHVKTMLFSPHTGYRTIEKTWTPEELVPKQKLIIHLDPKGTNFIEVLLEDKSEPDFYGITRFIIAKNRLHKKFLEWKNSDNPYVRIIPLSTLKTSYDLKPEVGKSIPKDNHDEPL